MGRPKKGARVLGPYRDGSRYKVIVISVNAAGEEVRDQPKFATQQEAHDYIDELRLLTRGDKTVGEAIEMYLAAAAPGWRPKTSTSTRSALYRLFEDTTVRLHTLCRHLRDPDNPNKRVTQAALAYRALVESPNRCTKKHKARSISAAYHHVVLTRAKIFFRWCCQEGLVAQNPLDEVKAIGMPGAGKPQHTRDQARRFFRTALPLAEAGDKGALAVLLALLLGLRQGELTGRRVKDCDNVEGPGTLVLRIRKAKTKKGNRDRRIPRVLDPLVRRLIEGRAPDEWLFPHIDKNGVRPHSSNWLRANTHRLCKLAGVDRVCAHALRGGHSTLAVNAGVSPEAVAEELGHESFATTQRHYLAEGTMELQKLDKVEQFFEAVAPDTDDELARLKARIDELEAKKKAARDGAYTSSSEGLCVGPAEDASQPPGCPGTAAAVEPVHQSRQ